MIRHSTSILHQYSTYPHMCARRVRQMEACAPNTTTPLLRVNARGDGFLYPTLAKIDLRGGLLLLQPSALEPSQPSQITYVQLAPKLLVGDVAARAGGKGGGGAAPKSRSSDAYASPLVGANALQAVTDTIAGTQRHSGDGMAYHRTRESASPRALPRACTPPLLHTLR